MSEDRRDRDSDESGGQRWRTALMRNLVRGTIKPFFAPSVPVPVKRQGLWLASRTARPAGGSDFQSVEMGGVDVEQVTSGDGEGNAASIIYLHGGVFCVGSPVTHRAITSRLARNLDAHVYAVDYRLAPEHPFPAALEDVLTVYRELLNAGETPDRIAIAGDSAGGGLALSTVFAARDLGLPAPAALYIMSPWVDLTLANSGQAAPRESMLSWPGLARAARLYAPGATEDPMVSPLRGDLVGLPPLLIQTGSEEILLAESQQLFEKARHANVTVRLKIYDGLWHVFQAHAGLLASADQALTEGADFLRDHLTQN
jgi:acetyl esterase/lipase